MLGLPNKEIAQAAEKTVETLKGVDATLISVRVLLTVLTNIAQDVHAVTSVVRAALTRNQA